MSIQEEKAIRILVVDDHFTVRMGLASSLSVEPDMTVVGELSGSGDVSASYASYAPTVVIMDLRLDHVSGIDLTRTLLEQQPAARVLMLSTYCSEEDVHESLAAGACGYVLKTAQREELLRAVRKIHAGEHYVSAAAADALAERTTRRSLTKREREVLTKIVRGCSNKEIAADLGLAEVTVKLHITHVLEKLGVTDRTQAAIVALQRGLVPDRDL